MLITPKIRARAQKQHNALEIAERKGTPVIRTYAAQFYKRALSAYQTGNQFSISKGDRKLIATDMAEFMGRVYVVRYQFDAKLKPLNLDFSKDVSKAARSFDIDLGKVKSNFLDFAGKKVDDSADFMSEKINRILGDVTAKQQPTYAAKNDFIRRLDDAGLTPKSSSLAETLVRTHAQIAFGAAQWNNDRQSDVIWGYVYVTAGDDRVREEHEDLEGTTLPWDDDFWTEFWPPNGWNCRCQALGISNEQDETQPPEGAEPDPGFDFNPGMLVDDDE